MKNFTKSMIGALALCGVSVFSASAAKPEVNTGLLFHTYLQTQQEGFGSLTNSSSDYINEASVYRARILFDVKLTENDYFFFETDLSASINKYNKTGSIRVLDAQYDHRFCDAFTVSAGKMLVSFNRNGLQTGGTLMANDFSYFQYNASGIMDNDCGRDIGINFSGSLLDSKLKYRLGVFAGHQFDDSDALRYIGRLQYNIIGEDDYSGTKLGEDKTFSVAAGFDTQGDYVAGGVDAFLDMPAGEAGSVTANVAYSYMTGGDDILSKTYIDLAKQNVLFMELGYYFKETKLQPWIKYELSSETASGGVSDTVYGGGLNYFFNGYGTNLRLSYIARENSVINKTFSQIQLQLQLFIF